MGICILLVQQLLWWKINEHRWVKTDFDVGIFVKALNDEIMDQTDDYCIELLKRFATKSKKEGKDWCHINCLM